MTALIDTLGCTLIFIIIFLTLPAQASQWATGANTTHAACEHTQATNYWFADQRMHRHSSVYAGPEHHSLVEPFNHHDTTQYTSNGFRRRAQVPFKGPPACF